MPRRKRRILELPAIQFPALKALLARLPRVKLAEPEKMVRQVLVLVAVVILALVMMNINARLGEYYRLSTERDRLKTEVIQLTSTYQALVTQMAYAQSDLAAEDFARNAHMIREGEKLVVPLTPAGNPTPTPVSTPAAPAPVQNWQVWWALFFEP
ncbi:MAG TPA: hypothetical protein DEQ80_02070 [Anaerolinea thermolimosa]|uniref:Septum formation initiator family protein n=1 Tax=Anaerolinea thermolimosa TaxID=229919 RepID=A0A3D1JDP7_9CHLR|nr:hypothetical protein [Anaerolinea thermolimosa]GAP07652.1 hypothetical protein ATHL_02538 [Anaerolinea thermolimosa]HCE16623.1 hypothetical protein [Anaerolinea thermolimosa]